MKGPIDNGRDQLLSGAAQHTLSPEDQKRLDELYDRIQQQSHSYVGYPCSANFDYSPLFRFLQFPLNNVGDPFELGTYRVETHDIEREVVEWFAALTHIEPGDYWGYVTNGGTEGNIYGLFLARERMPDGIAYYSEDAHYSVPKNLRVLNMRHIMIKSHGNGEMDLEDLRETIRIHRDVPPIIFANIGTTMTEAVDDVQGIRKILRDLAIPRSYIHCDAALSGMTLPFIEGSPVYDFRAGIDSLAISGHKYIGAPMPCGIVVARKRHVDRIARSIEYVGSLDTTISGSRNGFTPLLLWYAIRTMGVEGFRQEVAGSVERAEYAIDKFREHGIEAWRNPFAITVVFLREYGGVYSDVLRKWQIAAQGERAHMVVTRSTTREMIDRVVADLVAAREQVEQGRSQ